MRIDTKTQDNDCDISNSGYIIESYYNVYRSIG